MKKCEYCGREFKNQGGLNLHKAVHCKSAREARVNAPLKETKNENVSRETSCHHEWELLVPGNAIHAKALQAGFSEYCGKCKGVQ